MKEGINLSMNEQLMFFLDLNKCINCKSCEMACNDHYNLHGIHRREVLTYETKSSGAAVYISMSCNHCRNPVCMLACPENNFQKRQDGIVVLNATNCKSCTRCVEACPFQAIKINPYTNRVDKCNFCVERIVQGKEPICVSNCVTGALKMVKIHKQDVKSYPLNKDIPIAKYTKPSIYMTEKQTVKTYLRGG